jgi:hypothetical protein
MPGELRLTAQNYLTSFNCHLPVYSCGQYAECNAFNGKCSCPNGFGGDDCLEPRMNTSGRFGGGADLVPMLMRVIQFADLLPEDPIVQYVTARPVRATRAGPESTAMFAQVTRPAMR